MSLSSSHLLDHKSNLGTFAGGEGSQSWALSTKLEQLIFLCSTVNLGQQCE